MAKVFIAGATGYMGHRLTRALVSRGHYVKALARPGSELKLADAGCEVVRGDPLNAATFQHQVKPCDTWVHLVGVSHPSPSKAKQFQEIDLKSVEVAVLVAGLAGIRHFVYVSVAHPAPMMYDYIAARSRCEEIVGGNVMRATILRPWYVLGPGHRWPCLLKPFYWLLEQIPSKREAAQRLGLVTLAEMVSALVSAVEHPAELVRVVEVPEIRALHANIAAAGVGVRKSGNTAVMRQ